MLEERAMGIGSCDDSSIIRVYVANMIADASNLLQIV